MRPTGSASGPHDDDRRGTRRRQDPEARGPTRSGDAVPAAAARGGLDRGRRAVRPLVLPLLHGRIRAAAGDAPSRHSHRLRARPDLPRLLVEQERQRAPPKAEPVRHRSGSASSTGSAVSRRSSRASTSLTSSTISSSASAIPIRSTGSWAPIMIVVLLEATRRSVGWPLPIIAVVLMVYALCGPQSAGDSRASRQQLEKRRQPSLSHEPGHLRHRARRRGDLRLPLRAVRRSGDARRARPLLHRSRDRADRPLLRRARQGLDLRLGHVRHDLGLVDRQHRHGRLAHHSGDDPHRLCAAFRRRGRGRRRDRRADHAADHGRGRVPDGRVSRGSLPDDHRRGDRAGVHAFLRRVLPDPLRGEEARPAGPAASPSCRSRAR